MLSISEDSASARKPDMSEVDSSSGISLATTHSAARRIVPSPPKTTISSIPSSSLTRLESGITACASRSSSSGKSPAGSAETMPAALNPRRVDSLRRLRLVGPCV